MPEHLTVHITQLTNSDSAETLKDVDVRLIARNNEILATAKTDANGAVMFAPGLSKGLGGLEATLVVAQTAEDYGFIDLSQSAFDLTDRGVSGRPPPGAVDAFVYAERGVYRRGETVHATVLLRDAKANAMAGAPLSLVVVRPDGVEYSRRPSSHCHRRHRLWQHHDQSYSDREGRRRIPANLSRGSTDDGGSPVRRCDAWGTECHCGN